MAESVTPYAREFYDNHMPGSIRSARVMLPMAFEFVSPTSVLDIGCGVGTWLRAAIELGIEDVFGVDGDYVDPQTLLIPRDRFVPADLERPLDLGRRFDLVMSLEVAEHLTPRSAENFIATLVRHADVVLFSAAVPGQGGINHLNEQWPGYWAQLFAAHGYVTTDPLRTRCWLDPAVEPWYAQNALMFVREGRVSDYSLESAVVPGNEPLPLVHPVLFNLALQRPPEAPRPLPYPGLDGADTMPAPPADGAPDRGLRRFVTVIHADELRNDPALLAAYTSSFSQHDDATLVVYAPDADPEDISGDLLAMLATAGIDERHGPDTTLLLVSAEEGDAFLAEHAHAVLSRVAPQCALSSVAHTGPGGIGLLKALAAGEIRIPSRPDGLGRAVLHRTLQAAGAPDLADNVDFLRYTEGMLPPAPESWPHALDAQLQMASALEGLWDSVGTGSREVLVSLLTYAVLGHPKVRMPVGDFRRLREMADVIREKTRLEAGTEHTGFLGWVLDKCDLAALGFPIVLHSHPRLIINEFLLEQYRAPKPFDVSVRPGDVVIDGGGCWAETSLHFAHLVGAHGKVHTFEFNPENLRIFHRNLELNPELADRITLHRHPLWDSAGELLVFDAYGPATRVRPDAAAGSGAVETTSIDALVASGAVERVDFIKLDVEGSELAALRGARATLRRDRPRLAIAAYHRPDDLLVLPAFIQSLGVGYRIELGHFTMSNEETIIFAWCE